LAKYTTNVVLKQGLIGFQTDGKADKGGIKCIDVVEKEIMNID